MTTEHINFTGLPCERQARSDYTILIVEDNLLIKKVLSSWFDELGYQYLIVSTGGAAIDAWGSGQYDLVLLDYNLPDMTGRDVCRAIRDAERYTGYRSPIVLYTSESPSVASAMDLDGYSKKPSSKKELDGLIYWLLKGEN